MAEQTFGETLMISVGTAKPIENIVISKTVKVDILWFNIRTLIRNFTESWDDLNGMDMIALSELFWMELDKLNGILRMNGVQSAVYLTSGNKRLISKCPLGLVRTPRTDLQKRHHDLQEIILNYGKVKDDPHYNNMLHFDLTLDGIHGYTTHIVTHNPVDLLSDYNFGKLLLLESYTGTVKDRYDWAGKINQPEKKKLTIPFNILTLQVFGDKNQFYANKNQYKKRLIELSKKYKWTPITHLEKITKDLRAEREGDLVKMATVTL